MSKALLRIFLGTVRINEPDWRRDRAAG